MRKFLIQVNGKPYEVEVEELISGKGAAVSSPAVSAPAPVAAPAAAPVPAPVTAAAPAPAPAPSPAANADTSNALKSPMPGSIIRVVAPEGKAVRKGEVLLILEAMKMENEIMSDRDGVVSAVHVKEGDQVNAGDSLITIA